MIAPCRCYYRYAVDAAIFATLRHLFSMPATREAACLLLRDAVAAAMLLRYARCAIDFARRRAMLR